MTILPTINIGKWKEAICNTAPITLNNEPRRIVFLLPIFSPNVKAKIAPQNAPKEKQLEVIPDTLWLF